MLFGGVVEAFPPVVVGFSLPRAAHRLDHVSRIGHQRDSTRFLKILQSDRRRRDLGLLIGRRPEIFANRLPQPLKPKHSHRRRTRIPPPIPQARTVADYGYLFHVYGAQRGKPSFL